MKINHILFDLDDTLYRSSSGLFQEISRRMTAFVARYCDLDQAAAINRREEYRIHYGTTLGGLMQHGGLKDPEEFIRAVHPRDVDSYITPDFALRPMLRAISCPKSIFTNSPREHAERVLEFFGITDCFCHIFDIRFSGFVGKPDADAYRKVLDVLGEVPGRVLFIDDSASYLRGYQKLGGQVLQVREDGVSAGDWLCLKGIKELPDFLKTVSVV